MYGWCYSYLCICVLADDVAPDRGRTSGNICWDSNVLRGAGYIPGKYQKHAKFMNKFYLLAFASNFNFQAGSQQ